MKAGTLSALPDVYRAKFKTEIALQFAYRGALSIWLLALTMQPLVSLVVWTAVADSQGGAAGGLTRGDYAAYFVVLMIVNQLTFSWHLYEFEWRIRNGFFSPLLLRPIHPIHADIAENLTFKLLTLTFLLPFAVLLVVLYDATLDPTVWEVLAFVPALLLAMALRFFVEWTIGLAAFWVTRTSAILQTYGVATLFLSGMVAPLELFPAPVRLLATVLPFRWMVAFPVETLQGRLSAGEILTGLGAQAGWIAVALVLLRTVWPAALRRYSAVGA